MINMVKKKFFFNFEAELEIYSQLGWVKLE